MVKEIKKDGLVSGEVNILEVEPIIEKEYVYDVVIIGAGASGLTASLYASRAGLKTLLLERGGHGGQLLNTDTVENYTGTGVIKGVDLAEKMKTDALRFGADNKYGDVTGITVDEDTNLKTVHTTSESYQTKTVIIGTGTTNKKLGIEGEQEYLGRGVSYCAVCDGAFFRNRELVVIGGGDSAVEEGLYLTQFADKVTLIHRRDELRAQKILQDRFLAHPKTDVIWDANVTSISGKIGVNGVQIYKNKEDRTYEFETDGVFIYVGLIPNTDAFKDLGILDEEGFIPTNQLMETKISGVYATGDVRDTPLRQISTAVADGSIAGNEVFNYIQNNF